MFLVWQRVFFTLLLGFSSLKKSDKMRLLRILKQNVEKRENMRYFKNAKRLKGFNETSFGKKHETFFHVTFEGLSNVV